MIQRKCGRAQLSQRLPARLKRITAESWGQSFG